MNELISLLTVCLAVIFAGLFVAFSPVLIATELAVISRPQSSLGHVIALVAGIATPIIALVLLAALFLDPYQEVDMKIAQLRLSINVAPLVNMFAGILLIGLGLWLNQRPTDRPKRVKRFSVDKLVTKTSLYWFGLLRMLLSLTSIAVLLVAMRYIKTNITNNVMQMVLSLVLIGIVLLPFVGIILLHVKDPSRFVRIQQATTAMSRINYQKLLANACSVTGVLLILIGAVTAQ